MTDEEIVDEDVKKLIKVIPTPVTRLKYYKLGLRLPESTTMDEWLGVGAKLGHINGSIQWWIGDWLAFGERHYGEMYSQALESTDYQYSTLQNFKWVASRIEMSRRLDNLSWNAHMVIAKLEPEQQQTILSLAAGMTVEEVRQLVRDNYGKPKELKPDALCPACGYNLTKGIASRHA